MAARTMPDCEVGRARIETSTDGGDRPVGAFAERHYAVQEVADMWNLSKDMIRELFQNEAGVLVIGNEKSRHRRKYVTLRIPQSVLERVHRRLARV